MENPLHSLDLFALCQAIIQSETKIATSDFAGAFSDWGWKMEQNTVKSLEMTFPSPRSTGERARGEGRASRYLGDVGETRDVFCGFWVLFATEPLTLTLSRGRGDGKVYVFKTPFPQLAQYN